MRTKLNFRFHNPNSPEVTARYIADILIQANRKKAEEALREYLNSEADNVNKDESRIAG